MLSSGGISDRNRPEQQKYLAWFRKEKEKGLVDIKFAFSPEWWADNEGFKVRAPEGTTTEDIYRELNEINAALARGDFETVAHFDAKGNSLI